MTITPKYPDVHVQLGGGDGNAYAVLAAVERGLKKAGVDQSERTAFFDEATSGDYDNLLATAIRWVEVS